jgi:hypothetical protein
MPGDRWIAGRGPVVTKTQPPLSLVQEPGRNLNEGAFFSNALVVANFLCILKRKK